MNKANYDIEAELRGLGFEYIVGVDEVGRGCEHPSAEILTSGGWKKYNEIVYNDKVLSCKEDNKLVWQNIDSIVEKDFHGKLIRLYNRGIDILVTPDHFFDVFRRTFKRKNRVLTLSGYIYDSRKNVCELKNNDVIPRGGSWDGNEEGFFVLPSVEKNKFDFSKKDYSTKHIPMDLWLKFMGIYISEGSVTHIKNGAYVVSIRQIKEDNLNKIYNELVKLPFSVFKQKGRVVIYNKQLYDYLKPLGKSQEKFIPNEYMNLCTRQLNILFEWLLLGDGSSYKGNNRKRVYIYYTVSNKLKDCVEELLLKIGKTYHTTVRGPRNSCVEGRLIKKENCLPCYEIRVRGNIRAQVKSLHKSFVEYSGKVFCLCLPNYHNFYVRRNGTGYFTGNCGAGPVVAAAVYIPYEVVSDFIGRVNDSKKVSPKKRELLYDEIMDKCKVGIQDVPASVIDEINILEATKLAMARAIEKIDLFNHIIVDGPIDLSDFIICPTKQIIGGDSKSISIAAASIVAKVYRDRMMLELHKLFPIYKFDKNKGYLTKEHCEAIKKYGITDFHRVTFNKVGK